MEHPVKTAPCPLFFAANGGRFDALGKPLIGGRALDRIDLDRLGQPGPEQQLLASLLCDKAYDCGECLLLHQWVAAKVADGWTPGWECDDCLAVSYKLERDNVECERIVPGFYQAGRDPSLTEESEDFDPDRPQLYGCTSCNRGSSLLQLILRRARRPGV